VPVPGATPAERAESLADEEKRTCAEALVDAANNSSATISLDEGCDCLSNAAGS
jgi:hypothetical protein